MSKKESKSIITITDPKIAPYIIGKDTAHGGYVVYEDVKTDNTKNGETREYLKTICYPSNFQNALKAVIREKMKGTSKHHYNSLEEYVQRWERVNTEIKDLFPNVE